MMETTDLQVTRLTDEEVQKCLMDHLPHTSKDIRLKNPRKLLYMTMIWEVIQAFNDKNLTIQENLYALGAFGFFDKLGEHEKMLSELTGYYP